MGCDRLDPGPIEIGDHLAARRAGRVPIHHFARDLHNPDCWAAVDIGGDVYAPVGTRVPGDGQLQSAGLLNFRSAFLPASDGTSEGIVWPVPHPDSGGFSSGYPGTGPGEFACALTRRSINTAASVDCGPDYQPRFWSIISIQDPPLQIGPDVFDARAL